MNSFSVSFPKDRLDLELCVSSGQVFRWEQLPDESWLGVDGDNWFLVRHPNDTNLEVESNASQEDFVSLFRLDWDADAIEREVIQLGPELEPYLAALKGLRLLKPSSPVETFFCFLCTPNNNIARIKGMTRKLATFGPVMGEVAGRKLHRFPDEETIAAISEPELRADAFGYRAATIPAVARQVVERGEGWIESLKQVPYEEAHARLRELKGVGPKLADCIALFALHNTEAVPLDTHLWQAMTRLYFPEWRGKALTDSKYKEASLFLRSRFGKWAGWAHQYLFYDNVLNWRARRFTEDHGNTLS